MKKRSPFSKIVKIVLVTWLVLMIIISLGLIFNKLGVIDAIASKLKDNKYNDSIAQWEVESGLSKLSINNSQYKAAYSKLPSNIKIWDVEGTKIAYSNKIGSSDDYKGEFDLYIYDTENGKQEEILKLNNDNAIEKCVLDSKYIVWQDEKGSFFKNLDSEDEKVELPRMYQL